MEKNSYSNRTRCLSTGTDQEFVFMIIIIIAYIHSDLYKLGIRITCMESMAADILRTEDDMFSIAILKIHTFQFMQILRV